MMAPRAAALVLTLVAACDAKSDASRRAASEAELMANRLAKNAKLYYVKRAEYPTGTEALSPPTPCCQQPGKVCKAIAADWDLATPGHPWSELKLEVTQDGHFQYRYQGTAESFEAVAIGDPDCDGHTITVTVKGMVDQGEPRTTIAVDRK
jgi:hypothetical protein